MPDKELAIYLHWPFCAAKCPYCDFNSHVVQAIDPARWQAAYLSELDRYATELPAHKITSVYFGGGTPSLMSADLVAAVLDHIAARWTIDPDVEITLEANPTSIETHRFRGYRSAGVNRMSIGVQALNDHDLKRLGRLHNVKEALAAVDLARQTFPRVSFDLIYARQDQSLEAWKTELGRALSLSPDHLSLYQLTIEAGTAFGDRFAAGKLLGLPGDDLAVDQYQATQDLCEAAGLPAYEISNHARPGMESRHNLTYWQSGNWIGIGPGAHGRFNRGDTRFGTETELDPNTWLSAPGETLREVLPVAEQAEEHVLMGLRLRGGIDLCELSSRYGFDINTRKIKGLCEIGVITLSGSILTVTREGRPVLNAILRELLVD